MVSFNQTIPIFCLSLPRAVDRRQKILETWGGLGFTVTFVDAPDRRDFESIKKTYSLNLNGCRLNAGEICCLLGFAKIMDKILALPRSCEGVLVMEDDAIPLIADRKHSIEYLENIIRFCLTEFPEAQAILMHDHPTKRKGEISQSGLQCDSWTKPPMSGNIMFFVKKKGATFCKKWFLELKQPADWVWDSFAKEMPLLLSKRKIARHPALKEGATTYIPNNKNGRATRRKYIP